MSIDNKEKNNIEKDDLNIKKHLNNSLDKEEINISDDLVKRTLESTRRREKLAGIGRFGTSVAAAVLFIFVFSYVVKGFMGMRMKRMDEIALDDSDSSEAQEELAANHETEPAESFDFRDDAENGDTNGTLSSHLSFREITSVLPGSAQEIIIKDVNSDVEISLTSQEEIEEFYITMEQYEYSADEDMEESNSNYDFIIEMKTETEVLIIYIDNKILVDNQVYISDHKEGILQDLSDIINENINDNK